MKWFGGKLIEIIDVTDRGIRPMFREPIVYLQMRRRILFLLLGTAPTHRWDIYFVSFLACKDDFEVTFELSPFLLSPSIASGTKNMVRSNQEYATS
jgi:hypothetical protein